MPRKIQLNPLKIKQDVITKALGYALSKNEVGFIFFVKGNVIFTVERIRNKHMAKRNRFLWDMTMYRDALRKHDYEFYIEGHSHSKARHLRHPSGNDVSYFRKGLHIIVFPDGKEIRCWCLASSLKKTLKSEMRIILVNSED